MIRFLTAGESHGPYLSVIIDGLPAGLDLDAAFINRELGRRQRGYGRGRRMTIEQDTVQVRAGVRRGRTTGAPVCLVIPNRDHENWRNVMSVEPGPAGPAVTCPRPGHADLAGALKYGLHDLRDVLERASARETCGRVACGAICKRLLEKFGVGLRSQTLAICGISARRRARTYAALDRSPLRCADPERERAMIKCIDRARAKGDTVGGVVEVEVRGVCPGLGTYAQFDRRLDARIGSAMLSIPSVKGVALGDAFEISRKPGSQAHDEIRFCRSRGWCRSTNRAGGIEAGVSNGSPILIRLAVKPVPTLGLPLRSADILTRRPVKAHRERADVCVVPAVGIIAESMLAWVIADCMLEKFGSDALADIRANHRQYLRRIQRGR